MLISCLVFLWQKAEDAINNSRLPELRNGSYTLAGYPPDPYIRADGMAVDMFMITFTRVVVSDDAVRIDAVATNITTKKQELDCSDGGNNAINQWSLPTVLFSSGRDRVAGGSARCEKSDDSIMVKRHGSTRVVAEFNRDKRFTEDFVVRWGVCLGTDREYACNRYTTEHAVDLASAEKS
ncbi:hypothetical protein [Symbioplanes lichenis]|uniref:hypothetical protein n=1 Tax=Symbioplanes lichenis TaxID=1629072 RepID=UPI002739405E|nr:hypothetical protein [Actinoplanes lichenis]